MTTDTTPHTPAPLTPETRVTTFIPPQATATLTPQPPAPAPLPAAFPLITFHGPAYYLNFQVPADALLIGDYHLTRGDLTVIGGVPGCGKSRLLMSLAIAGKQGPGSTWMGMPVHAHFRTAIIQAENGEVRIQADLRDIRQQGHDLDGWLHITPPPPFGLSFTSPDFCAQVHDWLCEIRPGVVAIDPWNCCTPDDKAKDYRAVIESVRATLPDGLDKPALVIVHHLRKQTVGDARRRGRDLLNELSGSYVIGSSCRSAFVLEPPTPDGEDDRVIHTCVKNNNGQMGRPTAWHRRNGLFIPCTDFDWEEWENGGSNKRRAIELEDLAAIFQNGEITLSRKEAVDALKDRCDFSSATSAYQALRVEGGRFSDHLDEVGGFLIFRP